MVLDFMFTTIQTINIKMASLITKGSCQCGAIQFTLKGEPAKLFLCYCVDCRKSSGHLGQFLAQYNTSDVEIKDSQTFLKELIVENTQSGFPKMKEFCGACGSTIRTLPQKYKGEVSMIRSSLLDENFKDFMPEKAIFVNSKTNYVDGTESSIF